MVSDFVALAKGLNHRQLVPANHDITKIVKSNPGQDYYTSLFRYKDRHMDLFKQTGKLAGISDVTTPKILFDFDNAQDIEAARKDALEVCARLIKNGIDENYIRIYFSGAKGFAIETMTDQQFTRQEFVNIVFGLAGDLTTFDVRINDEQRIIRAPLSRHPGSKLYKIPLSLSELASMPLDEIKATAKDASAFEIDPDDLFTVELPEALHVLKSKLYKKVGSPAVTTEIKGFDIKDIDLTDCPKWMEPARFILSQGYFYGSDSVDKGERNSAFMILAATWKNQGFSAEHTLALLSVTAEKQALRTGEDPYTDEQLQREIVNCVFSSSWKGGIFGKDEELLVTTRKRFDLSESPIETESVGIENVGFGFKDFARNIDKNRIYTGLASLDRDVVMTSGMLVSLLGAPGCHAKGTKILMYDGSIKLVENVIVGDLLIGPDSKPREVLRLVRGREEMVRIDPLRSESFIVNRNHILHLSQSKTKNKGKLPGNINLTVDNYLKGKERGTEFINTLKLLRTGVDFNKKELRIDPYFLGTWLGDGHSHMAAITSMDEEIVNFWKTYSKSLNLDFTFVSKRSKATTYSVVSLSRKKGPNHGNDLLRLLDSYNLRNNKHIPQDYLSSTRQDRLSLLAGLIDTDGHYDSKKHSYAIISSKQHLSESIAFLARSLGFHASVREKVAYCRYKGEKRIGEYHNVHISGENLDEIPVLLPRKKAIKCDLKTNPLHQGFKCEVLPEDDFYGFTISDDHLYLTADFFIHHNCGKTSLSNSFVEALNTNGENTLYFSLDLYKNLLFNRLLQRFSAYPFQKILEQFKNDTPDEVLMQAYAEVIKNYSKVSFNFKSGISIDELEVEVKNHIEVIGKSPKLVVIDYLEKIRTPFSDATASTSYAAGRLADIAKKYDTTVLLLVQPSKVGGGDPRDEFKNYRAIKGSSSIESESRLILGMHRPGYNPADSSEDNFATISVLKNNTGQLGRFDYSWDGVSGTLNELDSEGRAALKKLRDDLAERAAHNHDI